MNIKKIILLLKERNRCEHDIVKILYGYPSKEGMKLITEGKMFLGGCIVNIDQPISICKKCRKKFGYPKGARVQRFLDFLLDIIL